MFDVTPEKSNIELRMYRNFNRSINLDFTTLFANTLTEDELESYFNDRLNQHGDVDRAGQETLSYEISKSFIRIGGVIDSKPKFVGDALESISWMIDAINFVNQRKSRESSPPRILYNIPHLDIQMEMFINTSYQKHIEEYLGVLATMGNVNLEDINSCRKEVMSIDRPFENIELVKHVLKPWIGSYGANVVNECADTTSTIYEVHVGLQKLFRRLGMGVDTSFSFGYGTSHAATIMQNEIYNVLHEAYKYGGDVLVHTVIYVNNPANMVLARDLASISKTVMVFPGPNMFTSDNLYTSYSLGEIDSYITPKNLKTVTNYYSLGTLEQSNVATLYINFDSQSFIGNLLDLICDKEHLELLINGDRVVRIPTAPELEKYLDVGYIIRTIQDHFDHLSDYYMEHSYAITTFKGLSFEPTLTVLIERIHSFLHDVVKVANAGTDYRAGTMQFDEFCSNVWNQLKEGIESCKYDHTPPIQIIHRTTPVDIEIDVNGDNVGLVEALIHDVTYCTALTEHPTPLVVRLFGNADPADERWSKFVSKAISTMATSGIKAGVVELHRPEPKEE